MKFLPLAFSPPKRRRTSGFELSAFYRLCLVNQHDWNVILDFIKELAFVANKPIFCLIQINVPFALGTGQDIQ